MPRGQALDQERKRGLVRQPVGHVEGGGGWRGRVLGVAPLAHQHRDHPPAVHGPRHLAAGHEREIELGHVGVLARVSVCEVDARARHLHELLAGAGLGLGEVHQLEHLGASELCDLHRSHGRRRLRCPASTSLVVVGSIAFDAVKTPFGERERMLGGSAVRFSLAASFFTDVRVVGPVGDDFGDEDLAVMRDRGVNTDDVERVEGGKTFFWAGEYGWDLNTRETLDTQLGVFAEFDPKLSPASAESDLLFLANIQPDLQREVREGCRAPCRRP